MFTCLRGVVFQSDDGKFSSKISFNRVLEIGMVDSAHFARWLTSGQCSNAKRSIFPEGPSRRLRTNVRVLFSGQNEKFSPTGE